MFMRLHWTKLGIALVALLIAANVFYNTMVAGNLPEPSDLTAGLGVLVVILIIGAFVRFAFKSKMAEEHRTRHTGLLILWLLAMVVIGIVVYPRFNWGSIRGSFDALTIIVFWIGLALFAAWEFPDWAKNRYLANKAKKNETKKQPKSKPTPNAHTKADDEGDDDGIIDAEVVEDPLDP